MPKQRVASVGPILAARGVVALRKFGKFAAVHVCLFYVAQPCVSAQPPSETHCQSDAMIERAKPSRVTPRRRARHAAYENLVSKVLELLPVGTARTPRLAELCRLVGVSERTLRTAFVVTLGMAPARYLRLRRLHLLRAALAMADHHNASVATVAARFGYTDHGRMAARYHALFGEYPSATLERGIRGS